MSNFLLNLLTMAPEPVRISTGREVAAPPTDPNYFAWLSGFCFVAAVALVWMLIKRARSRPVEERAFATLARAMHVSARERKLLHRMSSINGDISQLAMLVSPTAFDRCRQSMESQLIGGDLASMRQLAAKLKPDPGESARVNRHA